VRAFWGLAHLVVVDCFVSFVFLCFFVFVFLCFVLPSVVGFVDSPLNEKRDVLKFFFKKILLNTVQGRKWFLSSQFHTGTHRPSTSMRSTGKLYQLRKATVLRIVAPGAKWPRGPGSMEGHLGR
jgi:hypothetical protein